MEIALRTGLTVSLNANGEFTRKARLIRNRNLRLRSFRISLSIMLPLIKDKSKNL